MPVNEPLGMIVSLSFAGAFFVMGLYAIRHRWRGTYVAGILTMSFALALIGQPWVQMQLLPALLSAARGREGNVDADRQPIAEMQKQLASLQEEIVVERAQLAGVQNRLTNLVSRFSSQQTVTEAQQLLSAAHATDLTTQEERLKTMQRALDEVLPGLDAQQKKLADAESLIKNLYKRKRIDTFQRSVTNRVQLFPQEQATIAVFRLKEPAVSKSVDGYFGDPPTKPSSLTSVKNVVIAVFPVKTDEMPQEYNFTYTVNPNDTPFVGDVTVTSNQVIVGSESIAVP